MECITKENIKNKKVLLRCDFNVTIKDNKIIDDTKIIRSLETIEYLINNNNKLIILSHLGKIKTESDLKKNTLEPVYNKLKTLINTKVYFSKETRGKKLEDLISNMKEKEVILVENTRYEDLVDKLESNCDEELSKYWASLADVFVNDAFGSSHRRHASTYGIKKYIPSYYGLLIDDEITKLNELLYKRKPPFTVIMGGAKVDDKIILIKELIKECDYLILGGGIANTFIYAKNINIGASLKSEETIEEVKELLKKYKNKIIIPIDFYVENNNKKEYRTLLNIKEDDIIYDIGESTIEKYKEIINKSNTIFINGTMGLYENELYKKGTDKLLEILSESNKKVFVGGGDAVSSVNKLGYKNKMYATSTGGGATLEYIVDKKLVALED